MFKQIFIFKYNNHITTCGFKYLNKNFFTIILKNLQDSFIIYCDTNRLERLIFINTCKTNLIPTLDLNLTLQQKLRILFHCNSFSLIERLFFIIMFEFQFKFKSILGVLIKNLSICPNCVEVISTPFTPQKTCVLPKTRIKSFCLFDLK